MLLPTWEIAKPIPLVKIEEWASLVLLEERTGRWIGRIDWEQIFTNFYWTVRLMMVLWVIEPEVALTVMAAVPAGVDGTKISLELEQPAKKPAERTKAPNKPRRRRERCWLGDRRRGKRRRAPKGRKRATVILSMEVP